MSPRFLSAMSQWAIYFLPSIIAFIRIRRGKTVPIPMTLFLFSNLFLAWTVVVWILLMMNAFGLNPVPQVAIWLVKVLPKSGGMPMNAPQESGASPQRQLCGQCGGTGSMPCSQCQGRGQWYSQPTSANEVAQLQRCSHCMGSGRIRCPYCGGAHV